MKHKTRVFKGYNKWFYQCRVCGIPLYRYKTQELAFHDAFIHARFFSW